MVTELRQIVTIAEDMEKAAALYQRLLGLKVTYRTRLDPFGLVKLVLPSGRRTFLEILQPFDPNSRGAKFLKQDGAPGEKFFSLIVGTDDLDAVLSRADRARARVSTRLDGSAFMHPLGMNGVLIEILCPPVGTWPNAGPPEAQRKAPGSSVTQLRQAVVLVHDLEEAVHRWATLFGLQVANRVRYEDEDANAVVLAFGRSGTFVELRAAAGPRSPLRRLQDQWKQAGGTGEGVYMAVFQVKDLGAVESRIRKEREAELVRVERPGGETRSLWFRPRSMPGGLFQLTEVTGGASPWPFAGDLLRRPAAAQ